MKTVDAIKTLCDLDRDGRAVFTVADLRCIFPERSGNTFTAGLRRLVAQGILKRAAHGVYVNALSRGPRARRNEEVAIRLRSGEYSYVSLGIGAVGIRGDLADPGRPDDDDDHRPFRRDTQHLRHAGFHPHGPVRTGHPVLYLGDQGTAAALRPRRDGVAGSPASRAQSGSGRHGRLPRDIGGAGGGRRVGGMKQDLAYMVELAMQDNPDLDGLGPVVEKEILHYDILHGLQKGGYLDRLVFIGGYGAAAMPRRPALQRGSRLRRRGRIYHCANVGLGELSPELPLQPVWQGDGFTAEETHRGWRPSGRDLADQHRDQAREAGRAAPAHPFGYRRQPRPFRPPDAVEAELPDPARWLRGHGHPDQNEGRNPRRQAGGVPGHARPAQPALAGSLGHALAGKDRCRGGCRTGAGKGPSPAGCGLCRPTCRCDSAHTGIHRVRRLCPAAFSVFGQADGRRHGLPAGVARVRRPRSPSPAGRPASLVDSKNFPRPPEDRSGVKLNFTASP